MLYSLTSKSLGAPFASLWSHTVVFPHDLLAYRADGMETTIKSMIFR